MQMNMAEHEPSTMEEEFAHACDDDQTRYDQQQLDEEDDVDTTRVTHTHAMTSAAPAQSRWANVAEDDDDDDVRAANVPLADKAEFAPASSSYEPQPPSNDPFAWMNATPIMPVASSSTAAPRSAAGTGAHTLAQHGRFTAAHTTAVATYRIGPIEDESEQPPAANRHRSARATTATAANHNRSNQLSSPAKRSRTATNTTTSNSRCPPRTPLDTADRNITIDATHTPFRSAASQPPHPQSVAKPTSNRGGSSRWSDLVEDDEDDDGGDDSRPAKQLKVDHHRSPPSIPLPSSSTPARPTGDVSNGVAPVRTGPSIHPLPRASSTSAAVVTHATQPRRCITCETPAPQEEAGPFNCAGCRLRGDLPTDAPINVMLRTNMQRAFSSESLADLSDVDRRLHYLAGDGRPYPLFESRRATTPTEAFMITRQALGASATCMPSKSLIRLIQAGKLNEVGLALPQYISAADQVTPLPFIDDDGELQAPPITSLQEFCSALFSTIIPALIDRPAALAQWMYLGRSVVEVDRLYGWPAARHYITMVLVNSVERRVGFDQFGQVCFQNIQYEYRHSLKPHEPLIKHNGEACTTSSSDILNPYSQQHHIASPLNASSLPLSNTMGMTGFGDDAKKKQRRTCV